MHPALPLAGVLCALAVSSPGQIPAAVKRLSFEARVRVDNLHAGARTETIRASVPFPQGVTDNPATYGVLGQECSWLPLQYWPDGSIRIAQAQFTDELAPFASVEYRVVVGAPVLLGSFQAHPWVDAMRPVSILAADVQDTFETLYSASVSGLGETLQETPLVRVRRHRTYHVATGTGIGRDYLSSTFYVTEFRDAPFVIVDWILGNDYLGADDPQGNPDPNLYPLGAIDVKSARFRWRGFAEAATYLQTEHGVGPWNTWPRGVHTATVMSDTYLADGQTRRYRFFLRAENAAADEAEKQRWRASFSALAAQPLFPLADLRTWQTSGAMGLHGGPVRGPTDALARAQVEYNGWLDRDHFGTWGAFGDDKLTDSGGTPRNAPVSPTLAHAIQAEFPRLLQKLEQMAWVQAVRNHHLYGLEVDADRDLVLWDGIPFWPGSRDLSEDSLGRRALWADDPYAAYRSNVPPGHEAHGFTWFDIEHWTTDLLFDYWSISGDPWAKEELRQIGESLKGVLRLENSFAAETLAPRAEGWGMVSFVQVYLATRNPAIKDYALRRIREIIDPGRHTEHGSRCIVEHTTDPRTGFGGTEHKFLMPWQYAPLMYGYLAAYRFFEERLALDICEDGLAVIDYAWVTDFQDPAFGFVPNGLRFYVPTELDGVPIPPDHFDNDPNIGVRWGTSPLGGPHGFLRSALFLLAAQTQNPAVAAQARHYGRALLSPPLDNDARWDKWNSVLREWWLEQ